MKDVLKPAVDGFKAVEGVGKKTGSAISKGLKGFAAAATAVGGFGAAAVKSGMDFDATMSEVSAISGATGKEFDALRAKALEMGAKTKFSASEAAEAMTYMGMAGWKSGDMISGISGIMNLAAASGEDLALTSDIVTDALTAFGKSAGDSGHLADIMAAASSNANTNVSMLGESFKYVAPVAGALGYTMEDTSLALGLMANSGIKASQAGTSLRTAMTNMASPTKNMSKVMDAYGISLTNADGTMMSLKDVMIQLREKMGGLDEATQASAASMLFGKEAMSGMLAIINAAPADFDKLTSAINDCNGAAEEMATTMIDNLQGDLTLLGSAFESLKIAISDGLTPTLREFAKFGQKAMQNLLEGFQGSGVSGFMSALTGVVTQAVTILSEHAPRFAEVSMMFIQSLAEGILNARDKIISSSTQIFEMLINGLDSWLSTHVTELVDFGKQIVETLFQGFASAGEVISKYIGEFIPLIAEAFLRYHEALFTVGIEILGAIGKGIVENKDKIAEIASTTVRNIALGLAEHAPDIIEGAIALLNALVAAFIENMPLILAVGAEIITQIVAGISTNLPALIAVVALISGEILKIASVASNVVSAISTIGGAIGNLGSTVGPIISKISGAFSALWGVIAAHPVVAVVTAIIAAIVLLWNKCDAFREFWIGVWEACKDGFGKFADWCKDGIDKIKAKFDEWREKINEKFSDIGNWFKEKFEIAKEAAVDAAQKGKEKFDEFRKSIDEKFGKIAEWFKEKFTAARKNIESVWSGIKDFFAKIAENIVSAFTGLPDKLKTVGSNMMQGLIGGITSKVSAVVSKVKGVVNSVKNAFTGKSGFDVHSPSRWAKRVFENVMEGGVKGLQAGTHSLSAAAMKAIGGTKDALSLDPLSVETEDSGFTDYLQSMRDKFILFLEDCQESISNFGEWLTGSITTFNEWFAEILAGISSSVTAIQTSSQDIWTGIYETWGTAAEWFGEICENIRLVFEALTTSIVELFTAAKTSIQEIFASLQEDFTSACEALKEIWSQSNTFFTDTFTAAVEAVKESWSTVEEFFQEIWDAIVEIFNYAPEWFGQTFEAALMALQESFGPVLDYFTVTWDNIVAIFDNAQERFSEVGANIMAGLQEGIESGEGDLLQLMDEIKQAVLDTVSGLAEETQSVVTQAMQILSDTVSSEIDSMKSQVEELISRIGEALSKLESVKSKTKSLEAKAEAAEKAAEKKAAQANKTAQKAAQTVKNVASAAKNIVKTNKTPSQILREEKASYGKSTKQKVLTPTQINRMDKQMSKGISSSMKTVSNTANLTPTQLQRMEKYGYGGTTVNIYNPEKRDAVTEAREWQKTTQRISMGLV